MSRYFFRFFAGPPAPKRERLSYQWFPRKRSLTIPKEIPVVNTFFAFFTLIFLEKETQLYLPIFSGKTHYICPPVILFFGGR